jgi:hypothetical protein
MTVSSNNFRAKKIEKYFVEPNRQGYSKKWEGHHATNPCVIRFGEDPRVFLGYRAGGDDDYYRYDIYDVWTSHLGMAILDPTGMNVTHRLPLPIMTIPHDIPLPKNEQQYHEFLKDHENKIIFLHDFRFFGHQGDLYVIFHESTINVAYDCIVKMKVETFLDKIDRSIELAIQPVEEIIDRWHDLWWADDVWQPCGVDGTNRIFSSPVCKGDIVFFPLADGTLQMCHRPLSDGMAVLNTGTDTFAKPTPDGITTYGVFETCIRPGSIDNSHLGSNGSPTLAKIGDVPVYVDVTHGCSNRMLSEEGFEEHEIHYYPYLRIKDIETGELLYYSEEPILDYCQMWKEYAEDGEWVSKNKVLGGVMFTGGQIEIITGKNGLDDKFITYVGLGDTAVGAATFKLRDVIPPQVIVDIQARKEHQTTTLDGISPNIYKFPDQINGWDWSIENDSQKRQINIVRTLNIDGYTETAVRSVHIVPGSFDADGILFDGKSIRHIDDIGWVMVYKGFRWDIVDGQKQTSVGYGILIMDSANPEKIVFRSTEPIEDETIKLSGWIIDDSNKYASYLEIAEEIIPEKVRFRLKRRSYLDSKGLVVPSQMVSWQQQKSGMLEVGSVVKML